MDIPGAAECIARARPRVQSLLAVADSKKTLIAQTHDFPDPDTIASSVGLTWLLSEMLGIDGQIGYGGIVGRAENVAMIKVLGIKLKKTTPQDFHKADLVALLDTQPDAGNHSVPIDRPPDIVVDHHFERELKPGVERPAYFDVGGEVGTTSTKITELVRASDLTPPPDVATALFYGVKSDTLDLARITKPADIAAYLYLFPLIDQGLLSEIENPQVPLDYFRVFNKAIERGKIYGSFIIADLGEIYTPDLCAELADRLLQIEGIKHALATGWYENSLFMSLRTRSRNRHAGKCIHTIVAKSGLGTAGGHRQVAGARVSVEGKSQRSRTDLRRKVIGQLLSAFGEDPRHFQRMMTKPQNGAGTSKKRRPASSQAE